MRTKQREDALETPESEAVCLPDEARSAAPFILAKIGAELPEEDCLRDFLELHQ